MKTCPHCGTPMTNSRRTQCGALECRRAHKRDYMRRLNRAHRERDGVSLWQKRKPRKATNCASCDRPIKRASGPGALCHPCHWTQKSAERRVREKGAYVEHVDRRRVFERDGWRCQLCSKKVRRDVDARHPLAATLDHVVPLARGGLHEYANVQCAHYGCNSSKRDRDRAAQLALFG